MRRIQPADETPSLAASFHAILSPRGNKDMTQMIFQARMKQNRLSYRIFVAFSVDALDAGGGRR